MSEKWDKYYEDAKRNGTFPPWEASEPFTGLTALLEKDSTSAILSKGKSCIELGCGCSASSIFLAKERGMKCVAVDISELALDRAIALLDPEKCVKWVQADILADNFFEIVEKRAYDFVFDMQCFHVLRSANEERACRAITELLKPGGYAMVVTGAISPDGSEEPLIPGPPVLRKEELINPFTQWTGMCLESIELSRFNPTPHYNSIRDKPPLAWVALFRKP